MIKWLFSTQIIFEREPASSHIFHLFHSNSLSQLNSQDTLKIDMNSAIAFLIGFGFILSILVIESDGGPVVKNGSSKPPNCPHGKCFIDRCIRICSCQSPEGSITCTNNFYSHSSSIEADCSRGDEDFCPLGQTYRSKLWTDNFLCYCNNDESQTYECYDLSSKVPADARQLLRRNNSKAHQITALGGKFSTGNSIPKLTIH